MQGTVIQIGFLGDIFDGSFMEGFLEQAPLMGMPSALIARWNVARGRSLKLA